MICSAARSRDSRQVPAQTSGFDLGMLEGLAGKLLG